MLRWMALDIGSKTIGVALSDALKLTTRPLTTIRRRDLTADVAQVVELARVHGVERLIVGRPVHLDGTPSATLEYIEPLVRGLQETCSIPIEWAEERLSTKEAEQVMAQAGLPIAERRKKRNEYAAAVILSWYIEDNR
ncbi:MAG: Holliday junction resolvase RuvX [Acidobacteriota bacterium]